MGFVHTDSAPAARLDFREELCLLTDRSEGLEGVGGCIDWSFEESGAEVSASSFGFGFERLRGPIEIQFQRCSD